VSRIEEGFTLIELMIVVVIIGILAAIAIPNFIAMQDRASEGSTKANMHTFQLGAEDYSVQNTGVYAPDCAAVVPLLPRGGAQFRNPFNSSNAAYVDAGAWNPAGQTTGSTVSGVVAYQDSVQQKYQIAGRGKSGDLPIILTSGL